MKKEKITTEKATEFAVIETGGKQYLVSVGDVLEVELLGDLAEGDRIEFDKVLMVDNGLDTTIGEPYITGAKVRRSLRRKKASSFTSFDTWQRAIEIGELAIDSDMRK